MIPEKFKHIKVTKGQVQSYEFVPPPNVDIQKVADQVQHDTPKAIEKLEKLIDKYPNHGILYNLLGAAYQKENRKNDFYELSERGYHNNPNYLFTRIAYAQTCLAQRKNKEIPKIFDYKFDLHEMYPKRKEFHISEVAAFYQFMTQYALAEKDPIAAKEYLTYVKHLMPNDPNNKALEQMISVQSLPFWMRYGIIALMVLAVILVIWGIVSLVRWIF